MNQKFVNFIFISTVFVMSTASTLYSQTAVKNTESFKQLSIEVVSNFKRGKLKQAEKIAIKVVAMASRLFGETDNRTGMSYKNLGEIQRARKGNKRAAESLRKALDIFQKVPMAGNLVISKTMESLGHSLALRGKKREAESMFLGSLESAESKFGKKSDKLLPSLKSAGYYYLYVKDYERAEGLFIRRYILARNVLGKDSEELKKIRKEVQCLVPRKKGTDFKRFWEKISENSKVKPGKVLNGKALSLPKPNYSPQARNVRASGVIQISVKINKEGKVTEAEAICGGHPYLIEASRESALRAKFEPTTVDGKPVEVTGVIVYSFKP